MKPDRPRTANRRLRTLALVAGLWAVSGCEQAVQAEADPGRIEGRVEMVNRCGNAASEDRTPCEPVPMSIAIELLPAEPGQPSQTLHSDEEGRFSVSASAGRYRLVPRTPPLRKASPVDVDVIAGKVSSVDIRVYTTIQ